MTGPRTGWVRAGAPLEIHPPRAGSPRGHSSIGRTSAPTHRLHPSLQRLSTLALCCKPSTARPPTILPRTPHDPSGAPWTMLLPARSTPSFGSSGLGESRVLPPCCHSWVLGMGHLCVLVGAFSTACVGKTGL